MWSQTTQSLEMLSGIHVFGSAIIRVEPDTAALNFAVSRLEEHPKDAFRVAREAASGPMIRLE